MDYDSFWKGYETGVALHGRLRGGTAPDAPIASMSVTGLAADLEWFADLSGVADITLLSADYAGDVTASYSYDGQRYTDAVSMPELLRVSPATLFSGLDPGRPYLYFRFRLADGASLSAFRIYGVLG